MGKVLMKGNEVIGEAAILAGCHYFFGYPITPQSELVAYMAKRLPEVKGLFLQAESEVSAINMVYGASSAGVRVMTSSSSPGFSLKQEGISYLAAANLPAVIVNIARGGPGLGNIQPSQSDYFQVTKGGGHGDYYTPVLAPSTLQEIVDLTQEAFRIADQYRTPVILLGDGMLGQMMEPVEFLKTDNQIVIDKEWATTGTKGDGSPKTITSLDLNDVKLEERNCKLQEKYKLIRRNEIKVDTYLMEDAEMAIVAYGTVARICQSAIDRVRDEGMKIGLIRPISLWPYPTDVIASYCERLNKIVVVEMSAGQMVEDVRLSVEGKVPISFYGRTGGIIPTVEELVEQFQMHGNGVLR
ncbi:3-methyl-2-oxobutanoate dehydrogenase subunit VorB [Evansella tamaricis]|uniref:3-methyl-2-oxobutanoate dehydrogenase subunit VorB n=1 Tax=Evansella tamaricis TaxID=2069301 RepID=A0ABS6JKR7_9BACI|nr:3-methyl-2-oxobutanoate dehydrogenase subunit VorB [Evansella tamaricis]MBU9714272.1 3-methyl-2-oxobutanoate dehydrogenase subunit VorB [Evansella tamaricis]